MGKKKKELNNEYINDYRDGFREGYNPSFEEYTDKTRNKWSKQEQIKQKQRRSIRNKK